MTLELKRGMESVATCMCMCVCSFEVCGEVKLTRVPEGMSRSKKVRITNSAHASEATDVNTDNSGAFCVYLKPGKYSVKVSLL